MEEYNRQQYAAQNIIIDFLSGKFENEAGLLKEAAIKYLDFRKRAEVFQEKYFFETCNTKCYENKMCACCTKDGIITYFADVALNGMGSGVKEIEGLLEILENPPGTSKCVYLGENGCTWRLKPIVCEMFLCNYAMNKVFEENPDAKLQWEALELERKDYTWPDKQVLFDDVEAIFIGLGYNAEIMYMHNSPGLLMVKKKAGL